MTKDIYYEPLSGQPPVVVEIPECPCNIRIEDDRFGRAKHHKAGIVLRTKEQNQIFICKTCLARMQRAKQGIVFDVV